MALGWPRPPRRKVVSGLAGTLHAEGEVGLALAVDLGVEHLVLEVDGGLRLEVDVGAGGFDDLIVLARSRSGPGSAAPAGDAIRRPDPSGACGVDEMALTTSAAASVSTSMRYLSFSSGNRSRSWLKHCLLPV